MSPLPDRFTTPGFTRLLLILLLIGVLTGCSDDEVQETTSQAAVPGCTGCHQLEPDQNHRFSCSNCHRGDPEAADREQAHRSLIANPAHPDNAASVCGSCHGEALDMVAGNPHYTLAGHLEATRIHQAEAGETDLKQVLPRAQPQTPQELLDDLLRHRCLRCHVYHPGDDFASTARATGCGACHLEYRNGAMQSHRFLKRPDDQRCLSCHYGNHVGFDYYGRFEHDYNEEYRTPYTTTADVFRPYGIEYHQLTPDVHQQAGLWCIDCHDRLQVMGSTATKASCRSCHQQTSARQSTAAADFEFISEASGRRFIAPALNHPAHQRFGAQVSCQVCHARWSFTDNQTHLLRMDHDDFYERERLMLDGSSVTEKVLASHLDWDYDGEILAVATDDYFTGAQYPGIWLKGYLERRWEILTTVVDANGTLQVARPILDLHLSWVDADESVRFDNIQPFPGNNSFLPYVPHTIGPAGPFFELRLETTRSRTTGAVGNPSELE